MKRYTIDSTRYELVKQRGLSRGGHRTLADGHCAMEALAFVVGDEHSASPTCVALPLINMVIAANDRCPDTKLRNKYLLPLLPDLVGTNLFHAFHGDGMKFLHDSVLLDEDQRVHNECQAAYEESAVLLPEQVLTPDEHTRATSLGMTRREYESLIHDRYETTYARFVERIRALALSRKVWIAEKQAALGLVSQAMCAVEVKEPKVVEVG